MFGFKKEKAVALVAPVTGRLLTLAQVPDEVFSTGMLGEGLAIEPTGKVAVAPCSGVLSYVAETKHAYVITGPGDLEVMVHIGLDTVKLAGEGFKQLKTQGTQVKAGEPIIEFDALVFKDHELSAVTPMVLTNKEQIGKMTRVDVTEVTAGETTVLKVEMV